ncbi:D-alanyl-D-alanine dipeptidase [Thermocatellispora tengchongensis]|uniref:D-alanyl-D-alanine dipeptidase n=1 Tax=Thermocatellispora tengchongensis TaxID=1073253 RepID=A0A840P7E4_9ACTN|nr:M15 family metallopeptidase [Thermocatellispora tengchongensis]MBB5133137.1 D-alanyl-D-alanine dipeptidase [Thermocatellispora tengchongensis]
MRDDIVLISDARVAAVPVEESGEALIDVRGRLLVDGRLADAAGAYAHLREGLFTRLLEAERALPEGYRLLVVEGYRPPSLQRRYFEEYKDQLRGTFPEMSPDELHVAASRYVSPIEVAPHTAGAAVDLTLCAYDGSGHTELDMGTRVNANPEESDGACYTGAANISAEARANRKILGAALEEAGLVNYPTEWWHWSYGDRYWAMTSGAPAAHYGPREL